MRYETEIRQVPEGERHVVLRVREGRYQSVAQYKDARAARVLLGVLRDLAECEA